MLAGRFGDTTGAPYIEAYISLPRLNLRGPVSFLIDTGADGSILMPPDARKLAVNFRQLINPTVSHGIGGIAHGFDEHAVVTFSDGKYLYAYSITLEIAAPTKGNVRLPSLLGRDILQKWRLTVDRPKNLVAATPADWDVRARV